MVHAIEILAERWSLAIVRELLFGPRRFADLKRSLAGISANILGQRLERLHRLGIVEKVRLAVPTRLDAYGLTPWGRQCEPALLHFSRWGLGSPGFAPTGAFTSASLLLALKALFRSEESADLEIDALFNFQPDLFRVSVRKGRLNVSPVFQKEDARLVFNGSPQSLGCALLVAPRPIAQLERDGLLERTGPIDAAERFLGLWQGRMA